MSSDSDGTARPSLLERGRRLLLRPTMAVAAGLAASGAAFAAGNLLLARIMQVDAFGRLALAVALFHVFTAITPLGIDQLVLRHRIRAGLRLLILLVAAGAAIASLVVWAAYDAGGLLASEAVPLAVAITFGGVALVVGGILRSDERHAWALAVSTGSSWMLLALGVVAIALDITSPTTLLWLFAAANVVRAATGWLLPGRDLRLSKGARVRIHWPEAFSLLGIAAIGALMLQAERLIIPIVLDFRALAVFGVLASVAIFPFRLLAAAAGFVLTPQLRGAETARQRWSLTRAELFSVAFMSVGATAVVVPIVPFLVPLVTGGRYELSFALVAAACLNGVAKVLHALTRAIVIGCGTTRQVAVLNGHNLLWLVCATLGAAVGGVFGLTGLLVGVSLGSLAALVPSVRLAWKSLGRGAQP